MGRFAAAAVACVPACTALSSLRRSGSGALEAAPTLLQSQVVSAGVCEVDYTECPVVPAPGCRWGCACSACPLLDPLASRQCSASIQACADDIPRVEPGLALLANNSVYRLSDLVHQEGYKWRSDSVTVLCDPMYRDTVLREFLSALSSIDGSSLQSLSASELESSVASLSEGGPGYACTTGERGTSSLVFKWPKDDASSTIASIVRRRLNEGLCERSTEEELVVNLRMGDRVPVYEKVAKAVDGRLARDSSIKRIVFNGVLHFGGYMKYVATDDSIQENVDVAKRLLKRYKSRGLEAVLRSNPDADADLCYLASAPKLIKGKFGFATLVHEVRNALQLLPAQTVSTPAGDS